MSDGLKSYGEDLNSKEISSFLEYAMKQNDVLASKGKRGTPICIWGKHGIGKTEMVIQFAKENNWPYVYCAPAQFEEMGDLHGIPEIFDPTPDSPNSGDEYTVYRPPAWLRDAIDNIDKNKPGILILDDFNRAGKRILQGCMQLLQMYALYSWSLPPKWQIVLTANPEGGEYTVTEMDDAMITRMMHVTMVFNAKTWAEWAQSDGLDSRGIDFVLTYPEVVTGMRTTARSLTQFLRQVEPLKDLDDETQLMNLRIIGNGTLESETVNSFIHFCRHIQATLIQPEEILDGNFSKDIKPRLKKLISGDGQGKRVDRLKTICTRLQLYLLQESYTVKPKHKENLNEFFMFEEMDSSLRFSVHRAIANATNRPELRNLLKDRKTAEDILNKL